MDRRTERVGTYTVSEAFEHTKADYDCAAWSETIRVEPGDYPVMAEVDGAGAVADFPGPVVQLPGVVVRDYFASLYFGQPISKYDAAKNAGQQRTHRLSTYAHAWAHALLEGRATWQLLPDFEAVSIPFDYTDGQGRRVQGASAGIRRRVAA